MSLPRRLLVGTLAASIPLSGTLLTGSAAADDSVSPKNVIVLIGDGMGYNQVDLANAIKYKETYYQVVTGNDKKVNPAGTNAQRPDSGFQSWDLVGMSTNWVDGPAYDPATNWSDFSWAKNNPTDSAAAGTAMATGVKTYNAGLGVDPDGKRLENLSERAKKLGKSAGVVSSVQFSHATPASYSAHNESRQNLHEIANEQLSGEMDVVIGAGHPYYDDDSQPSATPNFGYISQPDWERLSTGKTDYAFVEEKSDFEALQTGSTPEKLFGVAQVRSTLQQARSAGAGFNDVPDLDTLTNAALNVLDNNDEGFFLMVEGGAIDWTGHANQTDRNAEEVLSFFDAVDATVEWVEANSSWDETLVVVTADHETGYLQGPAEGTFNAIEDYPEVSWNSDNHTNQLVPFFVKGANASAVLDLADQRDALRGHYLDNTEMATWLLSTAWVEGDKPAPVPSAEPSPSASDPAAAPTSSAPADPAGPKRPTAPGLPKSGR